MRNGLNLAKRGFQHTIEENSFQKRFVFHEWIDAKCIFLLEIVKNLVNCSFQPTMVEKNSFHKEFYFMS